MAYNKQLFDRYITVSCYRIEDDDFQILFQFSSIRTIFLPALSYKSRFLCKFVQYFVHGRIVNLV